MLNSRYTTRIGVRNASKGQNVYARIAENLAYAASYESTELLRDDVANYVTVLHF